MVFSFLFCETAENWVSSIGNAKQDSKLSASFLSESSNSLRNLLRRSSDESGQNYVFKLPSACDSSALLRTDI